MEFQILSRKDAVRYCKQEHKEKSIIISICDSSEFFQKLSKTSTNGVKDILYLSFDDIEDINSDSHRYLKNNYNNLSNLFYNERQQQSLHQFLFFFYF